MMQIIGHRGARGLFPENTVKGFRKALEIGVKAFELDVWATTDDVVVVHHDPIPPVSLFELPSHIPRLVDVLDLCYAKAQITVEVKNDGSVVPEHIVQLLDKVIYAWDDVIISSFDWRIITTVRKIIPGLPTAALWEGVIGGGVNILHAANTGAKIWSPEYIHLEESHVSYAHSLGLKVIPFTVNDPEDIKRLQNFGVDGIITDYPDRLI